MACAILHVAHEDIVVRLFVETLVGNATKWFNHLELNCITYWDTMSKNFLARFKLVEHNHQLFAQLSNSKMEVNEPMRGFMARFNRLVTHLSYTLNPSPEILLSSFVNALPSEIAFFLRATNETILENAQQGAIEIEDNMITFGKMKGDAIGPLV